MAITTSDLGLGALTTEEPKPMTEAQLQEHLITASAYALLFGVGMGALSDHEEAAIGLIKTSGVLALPVAAMWFYKEL